MKLCGERREEQRQRRASCSRRHHCQLERSRRPPASSHTHTHTLPTCSHTALHHSSSSPSSCKLPPPAHQRSGAARILSQGGSEVWVYRKSRVRSLPEADTFTAVHTYYIIFVRPPIGGSFPLLPSGGATAPRTVADKLRRVLNAAARLITGTRKFDRGLGQILHDQLHWLDVLVRALVTSASSALGVLNDYALYKSTHSLTHTSRRYNLL